MNAPKVFSKNRLAQFWNHICVLVTRLIHISDTEPADDFTELWIDTSDTQTDTNKIVMRADAIKYIEFNLPTSAWGYESAPDDIMYTQSGMYCSKIPQAGITSNTVIVNFTISNDVQHNYSSTINWETTRNAIYLYTATQPTGTIEGYLVTVEPDGTGSLESYEDFNPTTVTAESIGALGLNAIAKDSHALNGKNYPTIKNEILAYVIDNVNIHYETLLLSLTPAAEDWISNGKGGYTYTTTFTGLTTEESTTFSATANNNLLIDCDINNAALTTADLVMQALTDYSLLIDINIVTSGTTTTVTLTSFNDYPIGPIYLKVRKAVLA